MPNTLVTWVVLFYIGENKNDALGRMCEFVDLHEARKYRDEHHPTWKVYETTVEVTITKKDLKRVV